MCCATALARKLVIGVVVTSLLVSVESTPAAEYVWDPGPWGGRLWDNPQNWGGLGYPGPGDTAIIDSPPSLGPLIDTDVHVYKIIGPIANASGVDQVMDVIGDANVLVDDWDAHETGGGIITMTFADTCRVRVNSEMRWVDEGSAFIYITDDARLTVEQWQMGDQANGYAEVHMDGGYLETFYGDLRIAEDGSGIFDFSGTARVVVAGMLGIRARSWTSTGLINVSGNADITADEVRVGWGEGDVTMNVTGGAVTTDRLRMAADNEAEGVYLLNVSGGVVTAANSLEVPAHEDASGRCIINLAAGVIEAGAFTHKTSNWTLDFCGGVLILHADVRTDIYNDISTGHITAFYGRGELIIDFNNVNTGKTTVWAEPEFKRAWNPNPADRAIDVASYDTVLSWLPGDDAQAHYVYMSTDYDAVANRAPEAYKRPCYGHDNTSLPAGPLLLDTTYYWAVDELDAPSIVTPGDVWQFKAEQSRSIEGFGGYILNPGLFRQTWLDGCGYWNGEIWISNDTGSCVDLLMDNTHSGPRAMIYSYDNFIYGWEGDANYSEASREFDPALDLSSCGEKALVIWFYGNADNDSTTMWVILNGNPGAMHTYGANGEDPDDIRKSEWLDWNMRLSDFAAGGVDLSNVWKLAIGFGDKIDEHTDWANGIVHFDDIAVYPRRCVPRLATSIVDLNADCTTDIKDMILMSYFWLEDRR